jgi:haloacetate dehalogenase
MPLYPDGFRQVSEPTGSGTTVFARIGGRGPALLLLHGFPQTHAMWHKIVPELSKHFTCVVADLRGYGFSSCPANDAGNFAYSKRAMAQDMFQLMTSLGHERFAIAGHDRGGRVAYRMALDVPARVRSLAILDIISTYHMWRGLDAQFAMKVYHWMFLAQPHPLPEMLIEQAPVAFLDYTLASWTKAGNLSPFDEEALAEYRLHFATPEHIHASCNDYRAGWSYDREADAASRAEGKRITCPLRVVWGSAGIPAETSAMLDSWKEWAEHADGQAIDSGHFLAEENPDATLAALMPFLKATAGP